MTMAVIRNNEGFDDWSWVSRNKSRPRRQNPDDDSFIRDVRWGGELFEDLRVSSVPLEDGSSLWRVF